jgi:prepilin-type N-terminal cleavage/methylation domain-containing protein
MKSLRKLQTGFTLIETIVSIFIFTIIMVGTGTLFKEFYTGSNQSSIALDNVDQAHLVEFGFVNELRNTIAGSDGSYALNQAGNNQIIFYSTFPSGSSVVDRVRYFASSTTLYKGIITPSGSPLTYNVANEKVTSVQSNLAATSTIFKYYDGNYAGTSTPLSQPVNVNSVKFVTINLSIYTNTTKTATTTFVVSAGANIRSLKSNLGS